MREMGDMTGLLLLLWLGVTVNAEINLQKRIIGGEDCQRDERLYHVMVLAQHGNKTFFCGGSLISESWILTAAHCLEPEMSVVLSVHPGPGLKPIRVRPVVYKDHDIMLLELPHPTNITPVGLPDCQDVPARGKEVKIAGHAATSSYPNGTRAPNETDVLQCAKIPVVDCPWAQNPGLNPKPHEHRFCGKKRGVDVCKGDSGGGVLYKKMIYGVIVAMGELACSEPVRFMDICAKEYKDWIENTTKITFPQHRTLCQKLFGCG